MSPCIGCGYLGYDPMQHPSVFCELKENPKDCEKCQEVA
jgi:hypothetical protein